MSTAQESDEPARYGAGEEIANTLTHGIGLTLAIAGLILLDVLAARHGVRHVVAVSIYGASLILMYGASTFYHAVPQPRLKSILRHVDHASIFILIAGSYTPFALINLYGPWGWSLLGITWTLAALGLLLATSLRQRRGLAVALYIALGWAVVIAIKPLLASVAPGGIALLIAGGLAYTSGTLFYGWRRLPYHHAIWHVFVLLGSMLHFLAVLFYVIPVD
ncbi:PAQR family membrane homeostasis protein TrhA [Acidihalobacter ferrooxydans]|uniref:Hemolysin III n=1 Tax=Acidihalobacter ferrooxydans TaxID=1765967 RepID=A0A1P8UE03_9GAMM|nr:hemolysin III family protein [Acidihalobacter ferrooxydans]APZ42019.1 hemolysin III [Acidihalobacter ferrooxydans]